jgi:8-oxo-dGTP pyrophosphatase MutT (NUDIX family)
MVNHIVGVGALFYSKSTHRYLFLLRAGHRLSGHWGLVGGKVETGETIMAALGREISEEIGPTEYGKVIPLEHFTSDDSRFEYHTYLIPVEHEFIPTLNQEHKGYAWTHIEDHPRPLHPGVWRSFSFRSILDKIKTAESILT